MKRIVIMLSTVLLAVSLAGVSLAGEKKTSAPAEAGILLLDEAVVAAKGGADTAEGSTVELAGGTRVRVAVLNAPLKAALKRYLETSAGKTGAGSGISGEPYWATSASKFRSATPKSLSI